MVWAGRCSVTRAPRARACQNRPERPYGKAHARAPPCRSVEVEPARAAAAVQPKLGLSREGVIHTTVGTGQCQRGICLFCLRHTSGPWRKFPRCRCARSSTPMTSLRNMAAVAGMAAGCEDARHFPAFYCGLRPWAPESAGLEPTDCAGTGIGTLSRRGLPRGLGGGPWPGVASTWPSDAQGPWKVSFTSAPSVTCHASGRAGGGHHFQQARQRALGGPGCGPPASANRRRREGTGAWLGARLGRRHIGRLRSGPRWPVTIPKGLARSPSCRTQHEVRHDRLPAQVGGHIPGCPFPAARKGTCVVA